MLSRLASRGIARSLLSSNTGLAALPAVHFQESRNFTSSPARRAAECVAASDNAVGPVDAIKKYGVVPFWGMVAAIMVSKEIFILDAEFLLSCEIGFFGLTAYVLAGDTFNKYSEEEDKATSAKFHDAHDFLASMIGQYKSVQTSAQLKPEVVQQYLDEFKSSIVAHAKFKTESPKYAARAQLEKALQAIKSKEEAEASEQWKLTVDSVVKSIEDEFAANEKLRAEFMALSISRVGNIKLAPTRADELIKEIIKKQFPGESE